MLQNSNAPNFKYMKERQKQKKRKKKNTTIEHDLKNSRTGGASFAL